MKLLKVFRENFSVKVFVTFSLLIIIVASSFTCLFILHERKELTDNLRRKGELIAEILAYDSRLGVFAENKELLKNSAEGFFQYGEVVSLSIFTTEGKQLMEQRKQASKTQGREADQEKLRYIAEKIRKYGSPFYIEDASDTVEFWAPVLASSRHFSKEFPLIDNSFHAENRMIGFAGVVLDKRMLNRKLHAILLESILVGNIFLVIGVVSTYFVVKRIIRPLNKLTENVKALGKGVAVEEMPVETVDELGRLAHAFNIMVNERKKAERALQKSEKEYRNLVDNALLGVYKTNLEGDFLYVNEALCNMMEFESSAEMLVGGVLSRYKDPEDRTVLIEKLRKEHKVENFEVVLVTRTGNPKHVMLSASLEGDIISGMIMDITEREQAEKRVKRSEKKFKTIFDNARDGILLVDIETRKFYLGNEALCQMLGYSLDEIITLGIEEIHPGEDLPYVFEQFEKQRKRETSVARDIPLKKRDGNVIYVDINSVPITLGEKTYMLGMFRDITERKRAQEILRSLSRRLIEVQETDRCFLAGELHDQTGQNLTALGINLNIIRSQFIEGMDKKTIERLDDSLKLVEETIGHVRNVMSGLRPPVIDDYGLIAAIRWHAERFSERTGIAALIQEEGYSSRLPLDVETALFRIVQEVLTNVAKHAQAGQVDIILEKVDGLVQLTVSDDGIGFDPAASRQYKKQPGWGLITIEERAEALGGKVYVKSLHGKGTQIIVKLPC
jgi:PAS domain S-box-containing protein